MDILLEKTLGVNCYATLLKAIAKKNNVDFELMFLDSWNFYYSEMGDDEYSVYSNRSSDNYDRLLYEYHGIKAKYKQYKDFNEYNEAVMQELSNNRPVILFIDQFWCPWRGADYQYNHSNHAILATGTKENGYLCYDYFNFSGEVMPYECLKNCFNAICSFEFVTPIYEIGVNNTFLGNMSDYLKKGLVDNDSFNQMKKFSEIFGMGFDFNHYVETSNKIEDSNLLRGIVNVSDGRFQYAIVLHYLAEKFDLVPFQDFAERIHLCGAMWKSIWGLLVKASLVEDKKSIYKKLPSKFMCIIENEKKLLQDLLNYLEDPNQKVNCITRSNQNKLTHEYTSLPIEKYMNNKAFGYLNDPLAASFGNGFMIINDKILTEHLYGSGFKFKIACVNDNIYDNIVCNGQIIDVHKVCSSVMILSSAEYGHHVEDMIIKTLDNRSISLQIKSSSWDGPGAVFDETILWRGGIALYNADKILDSNNECKIYAKNYFFENRINIKNIILPYCLNMHIFSITLCG